MHAGVPFFPGWAAASPFGLKCLYPLSQTAIAPYLVATMAVLAPQGLLSPLSKRDVLVSLYLILFTYIHVHTYIQT